MDDINTIFQRIEKCIKYDSNNAFILATSNNTASKHKNYGKKNNSYQVLNTYLEGIIEGIDNIATEIQNNDNVLISVKHQKILRACFQIVASFGISSCLIPGLGISLTQRSVSAQSPHIILSDDQKYLILVMCTDFLQRCYDIPVLKNIIITFHLIDYLAALIQLAFAPLKKPGNYPNFTMTQEKYDLLNRDKQKYVQLYEFLVSNCFQPMLMKELLVLQNVADQKCPLFAKRVIAKEMSRRLTAPGGLLSLVRCLIDTQGIDTGLDWKKVEMICKIISTKHGNTNENEYLTNVTAQLKQILTINNEKYLITAVSCLMTLNEKYQNSDQVKHLVSDIFTVLSYEVLINKSYLPGTIVLTSQEIEHSIQILYACTSISQLHIPPELVTQNLYILYLLRMKCTKIKMKQRLNNIILYALHLVHKTQMSDLVKALLFGKIKSKETDIEIAEYESGLTIKYCHADNISYAKEESVINFMEIFNAAVKSTLVSNLFQACLQIFLDINDKRLIRIKTDSQLSLDNEQILLNPDDEMYAHMLNILSEISASHKVIEALKENPEIIINFVESILLKNINNTNDECKTIALVLLNTVLSNTTKTCNLKNKLHTFVPNLKKMADTDSDYIKILCKETISLILHEYPQTKESKFEGALSNVFDDLLPVRAHGIIKLGKLIEKADTEAMSKRHYVFCLLQEQLKDQDSYVYLSAINSIASLAIHCTSDVISVLCKEYLNISTEHNNISNNENQNKAAELRMKIGDVIVKVTRRLGEMAVVHKNILLNTALCACRDEDPLIRASALSNLAEIALVMNYKMGTIIYEVLLCIWSIIETDKAIECRRAAVMVISSLLKGLGQDTLMELKENLLPIYRTLNKLYKDTNEDSLVRLHAQLALEELNDIVKQFLLSELPIEKEFSMLNESKDIVFK